MHFLSIMKQNETVNSPSPARPGACHARSSLSLKRWRAFLLLPLTGIALVLSQAGAVYAEDRPFMILIDPGHGGTSPAGSDASRNKSSPNNATSPSKRILEKDITLELSMIVAARIRQSEAAKKGLVAVALTRTDDTNLDFTRRVSKAAQVGADCYIGIHFNAANGQASGPRAIIQQESKNPNFLQDKTFALAVAGAVQKVTSRYVKTPPASWHDDHELHGGWGSYLFFQLNENPRTKLIPACHLEVEFLDNQRLENALFATRKSEVFQQWGAAIAEALIEQVQRRK